MDEPPMASSTITDLTRGVYRKIYAGFITGRRINAVSDSAEALFWRLTVKADDFGNFTADPHLIKSHAATLRKWSNAKIDRLVQELASNNLIDLYDIGGERYLHIRDFDKTQPAGRNGKRFQRHPLPAGGIQIHPDSSRIDLRPETETENSNKNNSETETENRADAVIPPPAAGSVSREVSSSFSGSGSAEQSRRVAFLRWRVEAHKLWAKGGTQKHSDDTSTTNLFNDALWPEDMAMAEGMARMAKAMALIPKAAGRDTPMAYLTSEVKKLGGAA